MGRKLFEKATIGLFAADDLHRLTEEAALLPYVAADCQDGESGEDTEEAAAHFGGIENFTEKALETYFDELKKLRKGMIKECRAVICAELERSGSGWGAPEVLEKIRTVKGKKDVAKALNNGQTRAQIMKLAGEEMDAPTLEEVLERIGFDRAADVYEEIRQKRGYRTRAKAAEEMELTPTECKYIAIPTLSGYEDALSFYNRRQSRAFLMDPFEEGACLEFDKEGRLKMAADENLKEITDRNRIRSIDIILLYALYTIMLKDAEKHKARETHTIYIPDLLTFMGYTVSITTDQLGRVINSFLGFRGVVGVLREDKRIVRYAILTDITVDEESNTISFKSPYLSRLISAMAKESIRRDRSGKAKIRMDGEYQRRATNAYEVFARIAKEGDRNAAAVENVILIVSGAKRAGEGTDYDISLETLAAKNERFRERAATEKRAERRVLLKTLELLKTETNLPYTRSIPEAEMWRVKEITENGKIPLRAIKPNKKTQERRKRALEREF